jgi:uncharacterized damage-inducible protein DinB
MQIGKGMPIEPQSNRKLHLYVLVFLLLFCCVQAAHAQDPISGQWDAYDAEWHHVSTQLIELAEAAPDKDFTWRPGPGVRSTSEVYMHIVDANFYLLSVTGPKMPADLTDDAEKKAISKAEVIRWLKRSLEAVKHAHLKETPEPLARKIEIEGHHSTVDWIYLRIIIHANERMGQLVAYSRMNGVVPPWSVKTP